MTDPTMPLAHWRGEVSMYATVRITVGDPSAILRCTENHDDQGVPQPDERGGSGWRNTYYALTTAEDVLNHFADNCIRNGIGDASRLDGWADLEFGVVTMSCDDTEPDWVSPPAPPSRHSDDPAHTDGAT